MGDKQTINLTPVERKALAESPFQIIYPPEEKMPALVVRNFPALGRLAAMRFIEWAQRHPGGVVSLPTGKTPEHFISWVRRLLDTWNKPATRALLEEAAVDPARKPDMKSLHFVQIDEFYPIDAAQENSFFYYVNKYYIDGFGLDRNKALLIDCNRIGLSPGETLAGVWPDLTVDLSLRLRHPHTAREQLMARVLQEVDRWCGAYEEKIRALGGIGFFLGGIGPDGHVGFNVRGSDHHSTTRLTGTNYETQAAAATDLGGMEVSRRRLVITIGLETITYNPDCTAVIIAAGEAKAGVVADALLAETSPAVPASALRRLPNARFYLTRGAALRLTARQADLYVRPESPFPDERVEKTLIDCSLERGKRLVDLTEEDVRSHIFGSLLLQRRPGALPALAGRVRDALISRIEAGARVRTDTRFLHTEPHHDDVMLGYLPAVVRHVRSATNIHYFATLTSGFTAVTNAYMVRLLADLDSLIDSPEYRRRLEQGYFQPADVSSCNRDLWRYLDGVAGNDEEIRRDGASRRLLRNLLGVYADKKPDALRGRIVALLTYFENAYPGKKDPPDIQKLKGMCREWEAECLWGYFGWNCDHVMHLRLGFYTGDIFTPEPTADRDVPPVLEALERIEPDVVTLAFDPEASGPDTHYKVLQALTEALRRYGRKRDLAALNVWGYRNVWFRFHPSEANIYIPVSLNMFSVMESAFLNTFVSQKNASFPSYEWDGPFCDLARKIQIEQYRTMVTCLGRDWFYDHPSPLIRATRGLVYLKEMTVDELFHYSRQLKQATENA